MSQIAEQVNRIISERRSIYPKMFKEGVIDDSIIRQMLDNAHTAPNHKKTYPWRFIVFAEEGRSTFAEWQSNLYKEKTTKEGTFNEMRYEKLKSQPLKCSHIIAVIMKRDIENRIPEVEEIAAVSCAVQNIYLTASAYDVGMYWGTGGVTYFEEAKEHFSLDSADKIMGFLYLGLIESRPASFERPAVADYVQWVND